MTRPGAIAAVAVVSAVLGGTLALALGKAVGWVDDDEQRVQTVLVPTPDRGTPAVDNVEGDAAKPLVGNGFDAAELYRKRAEGVVTIFALFGEGGSDDADVSAAQGSGFVVSEDGYILTNSHVITTAGEADAGAPVAAADTVYVQFRDGERVPAEVVGWDVFDDVGVLKVDPADHPVSPVPLGDSSAVVVGEPVAAIGSPFGQESSLSVGVVSATERSIDSITSGYNLVDAIQTDAPINRGNSGGPMFDAGGDVIGVNAQIRSESGTAEGVGFAIPINAARRSMEQLIQTGEVRYAWLGVTTQSVTPRMAERFGLAETSGAAVQSVAGGSPADRAGLRGGSGEEEFDGLTFCPGGDVIVAVDGQPVGSAEDVVRAVNQQRLPGDEIRLTILRGSERLELTATLGDRPANPPTLTC
ncbi:MAG TPA: trypsin-like peptidase domain-containing protein [Gaiellaceae bacterium]|nr:trypsin-like peptidase domain-containing protein [Gaiellaceae bacterium]